MKLALPKKEVEANSAIRKPYVQIEPCRLVSLPATLRCNAMEKKIKRKLQYASCHIEEEWLMKATDSAAAAAAAASVHPSEIPTKAPCQKYYLNMCNGACAEFMHCRCFSRFLKGWNATTVGLLQLFHPAGGAQCSSTNKLGSKARETFNTFHMHWSINMSSPHLHGPEHILLKCATQVSMPLPQVATAFRENTSKGPCKPNLQLFR